MVTDAKLGLRIHKVLVEKGVETPLVDRASNTVGWLDTSVNRDYIRIKFAEIMGELGLDLKDDSLQGTPARVAKMFVSEIFAGLDYANFPKITVIENKMTYDEMIVEKCVSVKSSCEHHFVVIDGLATVAYIPSRKVIGLSKLNRIVNFFSRRPQVQERLTEQVHATLVYLLDTEDVAVVIDATHFCVKHRGIEDGSSYTSTSKLSGRFRSDPSARSEFMSLARSK